MVSSGMCRKRVWIAENVAHLPFFFTAPAMQLVPFDCSCYLPSFSCLQAATRSSQGWCQP
jgi:hypothetical protein